MLGIKTRLKRVRLDLGGGRADASRLRARHPSLVPSQAEWEVLRAELLASYDDYVANVSTAVMCRFLGDCHLPLPPLPKPVRGDINDSSFSFRGTRARQPKWPACGDQ
jgi:hypothetical protein